MLPEGDALLVALLGAESAIGLGAGLAPSHAISRAAVELPGTAAFLGAEDFAAVASRSEAVRTLIARHADALLAQVQTTAACNVSHPAEARICRWLLQSVDAAGTNTIATTQEDIGDLLGVRRTTVTLIAQALKQSNVIKYQRGSITVLDTAALRAASCGCHSALQDIAQGLGR